MEQLAQALMRLFALGLDLDEYWFDDKIDKHMTNLTANWYPDQRVRAKPGQLRAGAHTDYGSLTILKTENKPGGLEVQTRQGNWAPVPIIPGTFIVDIGDLMAQWTNDRWISTMHRVANPPRDMTTGTYHARRFRCWLDAPRARGCRRIDRRVGRHRCGLRVRRCRAPGAGWRRADCRDCARLICTCERAR
jgi:isopenicillin N synthase-like dioxygenase